MWKFNFGNKKKEEKKELNVIPQDITYDGDKCYWIHGVKVIQENNGLEIYAANVYVTDKKDDAVLIDFPSPIAFELPKGRPDLIYNLIQMFDQTKSGRELSDKTYTYIGNIKPDLNGNLYYRNEPPSLEVARAIRVEEINFQKQYQERINKIKQQQQEREKARQENEFRTRLKILEGIHKNIEFKNRQKQQRLNNPYFKRQDGFGTNPKEGYDAINLNDGKIMVIRNIEKFRDFNGRYLYTAYIREEDTESYTEYVPPIGKQIVFTVPGRLSDIISNQDMNRNLTNSIQKMLSNAASFLEKNEVKGIVDVGGVLTNGQIVENSERFGISKAITGKIQSLGATPIKNISLDR